MEGNGETPVSVTMATKSGQELYHLDAGNLFIFDPSTSITSPDEVLEHGKVLVRALVQNLLELPSTVDKVGRLVTLPPPTIQLPREKVLPKARPPTKWEQFAQKKGIVKRKRSRLEFDEGADEWRRRHGFKRVRDDNDIPVLPAKDSDVPGEDPFTKRKEEKKQRVAKQGRNQLVNLKRAAKIGGKGALPSMLQLAATSVPITGSKTPTKRLTKDSIGFAAGLASTSTASIGKFDKKRPGEKPAKLAGKHRKFFPVIGGTGSENQEKTQLNNVLSKVLAVHNHDILNIGKAVNKFNMEGGKQNVVTAKGRKQAKNALKQKITSKERSNVLKKQRAPKGKGRG